MQIFFEVQRFDWKSNCSDQRLCANASLYLLDRIKYTSTCYVFFGILAFVASLPIILTIIYSNRLRNKSYFLVANLAFWDLLASSAFIYKGAKRLYYLHNNLPETMSQYQCLLEETALVTSLGGDIVVFLLTALDRFFAIVFPAWYQFIYPFWLHLFFYAVGYTYLFYEVASLYPHSLSDYYIPICSFPSVSHVSAIQHQGYRTKAVIALTIIVYVLNIFWVYYQLKQAKKKGLNLSITRKRLQVRVLWTLLLILSSFALTIVLAHVMYSIALVQEDFGDSLNLATFCGTFICINGISNFPILYYRTKAFEIAAKELVKCGKFSVISEDGRNGPTVNVNVLLREQNEF